MKTPLISQSTWTTLVKINHAAHAEGWAESGVFGTAIGPDYLPGGPRSLLYVGKSAGPLGTMVGSSDDQVLSSAASTKWMIDRTNKSAFWQMVDLFDRTRRSIAWTNISKMDRLNGAIPPRQHEWARMRDASMNALSEELVALIPRVALFATSDFARSDVIRLLQALGYGPAPLDKLDGRTAVFRADDRRWAVLTKHPQGWARQDRDAVVALVMTKLD